MEGRLKVAFLVALVAAASVLHGSSAQTTHVVGDGVGWIIPPNGEATYRTWAATRTFRVGDVLVFNFRTAEHDVAEVNKAAYDSCNIANPISLTTNGPARINLTSAGEHHYICTVGQHCARGQQKLSINVGSTGGSAPSPTTGSPTSQPTTPFAPSSPPPATAPPPPNSSASSVAMAALPLSLLIVALAFL